MEYLPLKAESNISPEAAILVSFRCPECLTQGTFHGVSNVHDLSWTQPFNLIDKGKNMHSQMRAGIRLCPNPKCRAPVFVIMRDRQLIRSYPPEVIDFNATDIPVSIKSTLEEAIQCHAHSCFKASALMVRRLLEEVCKERGVTGKDLKERIRVLGTKIVIPAELLDGADELRLMGNDAAHIEAKAYDDLGKEEVEAGIELAKEILKAVYQYSSLLAKLRALKKDGGKA